MSTHSNHSDSNYPEDGVSHYPHLKGPKRAKGKGPLHNVANSLSAKARALKKAMNENGGRHGGYQGYSDSAMKRFTANKERKHRQWDKEGK